MVGLLAKDRATEPFSEQLDAWFSAPVHLVSAPLENTTAILSALKNADFKAVGKLMPPVVYMPPRVEMAYRFVPNQKSGMVVLELSIRTPVERKWLFGKKRTEFKFKRLEQGLVSRSAFNQFEKSSFEEYEKLKQKRNSPHYKDNTT